MEPQSNCPGIYTLVLYMSRAQEMQIGSLGVLGFEPGYYSYTGSARGPGGLKRVDRHIQVLLGQKKTRRWHIDYLLPHTSLLQAFVTRTTLNLECQIAARIGERLEPIRGFGCTDCCCISHLHYSDDLPGMLEAVGQAHHEHGSDM
ncbi:MAG: GIY-YIG nuclease family protein [Methanothrix sp.]|nr:GIY-YIG nuclease family protein [Methanothrix sp.]